MTCAQQVKSPLCSLVVPASPSTAGGLPTATPKSSGRFAVYDLEDRGPPRTFHEAAEQGDTAYIVKVIERTIDFDINQQDKTGRTALHWAAETSQLEAAKTLIDFGINVAAKDCIGRTAVHSAARAAGADMLAALLDTLPELERADLINLGDKSGITAVFLAYQRAEEGQACFEYLMANGARFNQQPVEDEEQQQQQQQVAAGPKKK